MPYTIPAYSLNILPGDQLNSNAIPDYFIPIGKILLANGRLSVDTSYIPPCCSVRNHALLYEYYYDFGNKLGEIKALIVIIHKIKTKSQSTSLTQNFNFMADKVVFFTANELSRYRWIISEQAPVYMLEYFIRFAYVLKLHSIVWLTETKKNWLIILRMVRCRKCRSVWICTHWCYPNWIQPSDISECLVPADRMLNLFYNLFGKLSQLDFIGKRKGEGSFVRERIVEAKQIRRKRKTETKGWSFLAD